MPRHRSHSTDFKRQVVAEYHAGETLHALGRRHDLSRNLIRIWVEKAEAGSLDQDMASAELLGEYETRIAALERLVGRQALEIEFLKGAQKSARIAEKRAYIRDQRPRGLSIERGCALMGLPAPPTMPRRRQGCPTTKSSRRCARSPTSSNATATALGPCRGPHRLRRDRARLTGKARDQGRVPEARSVGRLVDILGDVCARTPRRPGHPSCIEDQGGAT